MVAPGGNETRLVARNAALSFRGGYGERRLRAQGDAIAERGDRFGSLDQLVESQVPDANRARRAGSDQVAIVGAKDGLSDGALAWSQHDR